MSRRELHVSDGRVEFLPDGSLRITETCNGCLQEIDWDYVAIADDGRFLVGHCACAGQRHTFALGPRDQVVDRYGWRI